LASYLALDGLVAMLNPVIKPLAMRATLKLLSLLSQLPFEFGYFCGSIMK
jgi:hypothetical protein